MEEIYRIIFGFDLSQARRRVPALRVAAGLQLKTSLRLVVTRQGFEPQLPGPEPGVLPLDDRVMAPPRGFEPRSED